VDKFGWGGGWGGVGGQSEGNESSSGDWLDDEGGCWTGEGNGPSSGLGVREVAPWGVEP